MGPGPGLGRPSATSSLHHHVPLQGPQFPHLGSEGQDPRNASPRCLLALRFSDAKTATLGKGFWFLKRGLWQI